MAQRIKELTEAMKSQNQTIITLRNERLQTKETLSVLYGNLVKYKPDFIAQATSAESEAQYPEMRNEDLSRSSNPELIKNIGRAMGALVTSLTENRDEIHAMYKELDYEVSSALEEWNRLKAQEDSEKKKLGFREDLLSSTQQSRSLTPELPIIPRTPSRDNLHFNEVTPDSTNKGQAKREQAGKSKSGTGTLGNLLSSPPESPTTAKANGKSAPVKQTKTGKA